MFSSIGWGEVLVVVIVGIIVIGPERLPRLITDVRAMIKAARDAVATARKELDDEFGDDFDEFRKPLSQLNDVRQMGAKGLITKTLLDGDDSFLTDLESSARSVSDAARGRGSDGDQSGTAARTTSQPTQPSQPERSAQSVDAPADPGTAAAGSAAAATEPARSAEPGGAGGRGTHDEARVELPQQQDAGTSRDWSAGSDFDDAL
ncbi:Sec-independent protein translocase protein TatB [Corynebacterium nuruki]|uniref:Sec-independent protein translocase protein TatB n=1 Tax=Corynebacterium nuruki TaxID=1032851 RepID=UPI0039BFE2E9